MFDPSKQNFLSLNFPTVGGYFYEFIFVISKADSTTLILDPSCHRESDANLKLRFLVSPSKAALEIKLNATSSSNVSRTAT